VTSLLTTGGTRSREVLDDDVDLARDRVLVTRAQSGDRSAFDDLYVRYYRRLYRFCLRRLHDGHEAEDVAQESFARAWKALPNFAGDRRFYPWLSVIAAHLCTDVLRRRNRSTPVAEFHQSNIASTEDGGEELMLAAVDSDLVARAFQRLSDRHQRILNLREGSGWSYQRIADHEGVGITAVETLLWRARQALKREFAALAGSEGRTAAWIGGILSLAALRRLLRVPGHVARRLVHVGQSAPAVAVGSAAAATAMVVAATLSGPSTAPQSPAQLSNSSSSSGAATPGSPSRPSLLGGSGSNGPGAPNNAVGGSGSGGNSSTNSPAAPAGGSSSGTGVVGGNVSGTESTVGNTVGTLGTGSLANGSSAADNTAKSASSALSDLLQPLTDVASPSLSSVPSILSPLVNTAPAVPSAVEEVIPPVSTPVGDLTGGSGSSGGGLSSSSGSSGGATSGVSGAVGGATSDVSGAVGGATSGVSGALSGL
jgi:RNA polymerase sigma-70 factor, ECF subfamily